MQSYSDKKNSASFAKSQRSPGASRAVAPESSKLISGRSLLAVPSFFTIAFFLLSFLPRVQENQTLVWSFWGATAVLGTWLVLLYLRTSTSGTKKSFVLAAPRPQHYIQAMVHLSVYTYWGWHWPPVQEHAQLLLAQLLFAYVFDILMAWTRRDNYLLGFGPFPIIFSTNLFMWFRDDWFYLQFLMIAVGFMGKEFVRWNRDGRSTHIFNPSAFTLGLFSLALILSNSTDITWGPQIASTLSLAPGIYSYLFLGGLVVMYFFSITLIAASAAAVLFGLSALYYAMTGVPYFLDSEIPTAVFLGLHLLVTDPSTSPRTPPGKLMFGILYGLGVFALYSILSAFGAPTFYDKLLCVPLLNLSVQWIDRAVQRLRHNKTLERIGLGVIPSRRANLAHMAVWIVFFVTMTSIGKTDGRHVGDSVPFWADACAEVRANACDRLLLIESNYCADNSGWACNEIGAHYMRGDVAEQDTERALGFFARACELRFQAGCLNVLEPELAMVADPRAFDLRLLLREGGQNLLEMPESDLYERACEHGWFHACQMSVAGVL
jgi:TPR repeat protein